VIRAEHLVKKYPGGHEALVGVSFHIERGEMSFVTGHSGAGKSTLLRLIAGIEPPTRGRLSVDGHNLARLTRRQRTLLRRRMGLVFQDPQLLYDRNVFDNVALPLQIANRRPREIQGRVRAVLEKVGLGGKEQLNPRVLSGGEQQRVGIARAVVSKPDLILADEPTGNLDPDLAREIMDLFRAFNDVGVTVLIATHDIYLIEALPYRRLILDHGRLREGRS